MTKLLYDHLYYGRVTATVRDGNRLYKNKKIFTKEEARVFKGREMTFVALRLASAFREVNQARRRDLEGK